MMNQTTMNDATLRGKWNQLKGRVKEQFGQLTEDDLLKASGSVDRVIGVLQERYGYTKEQARTEWNKFIETQTAWLPEGQSTDPFKPTDGVLSNVAHYVQEVATTAMNQGKQVVEETLDDVLKRTDSIVTEQQQQAAQSLQNVAGALHSSSHELRKGEQETFADYATAAANYVDEFSNYLRNRRPVELWDEVQSFARRQPEVFVLGTLAAGFLLGRFLRSSEPAQVKNFSASRATPTQFKQAIAAQRSHQDAVDGQKIAMNGATGDSYREGQKYTTERALKPSQTSSATTYGAPTIQSEDRPLPKKKP